MRRIVFAHPPPTTFLSFTARLLTLSVSQFDAAIHGDAEPFWITVTDVDGETILYYEYFLLKRQYATEEHTLVFTIPLCDPLPPQYYVHAVSDRWLGAQVPCQGCMASL